MSECIFCQILVGTMPTSFVHRDELCSAFMDIQPVNPGHILVVPNQHAENLAELDENTGAHIFKISQKLSAALRQSGTKCDGINFFLADGAAAMQEVFHFHLHVFPRYHGDGFGLQHPEVYYQKTDRKELDAVAAKIKGAFNQLG